MREFMITSDRFTGAVLFGYDSDGILRKYENNADLNEQQLAYFTTHFPLVQEDIYKIKGGKLTEVTDLSFEHFWEEYAYKVSKKEAQKEWNRLKDTEKMQALMAIDKYRRYVEGKKIEMAYPATYLNKRRFEDEYPVAKKPVGQFIPKV